MGLSRDRIRPNRVCVSFWGTVRSLSLVCVHVCLCGSLKGSPLPCLQAECWGWAFHHECACLPLVPPAPKCTWLHLPLPGTSMCRLVPECHLCPFCISWSPWHPYTNVFTFLFSPFPSPSLPFTATPCCLWGSHHNPRPGPLRHISALLQAVYSLHRAGPAPQGSSRALRRLLAITWPRSRVDN